MIIASCAGIHATPDCGTVRQIAEMGSVERGVVVANARFHDEFVVWCEKDGGRLPLDVLNDGATTNETRLGAVRDLALGLEALASTRSAGARAPSGYLVPACDNLFEFNLGRLVRRFAQTRAGQLVVRRVPEPVPPSRYSEVLPDESGTHVLRFREKPANPESDVSAIAVYLLPRELPALVGEYLASGGNPDAPGHLLVRLSTRVPLEAAPLDGRWLDSGSAEDLERAGELSPVQRGMERSP